MIPSRASDAGPESGRPITRESLYQYLLDDADDALRNAGVFHDDRVEERRLRLIAIEQVIEAMRKAMEVA